MDTKKVVLHVVGWGVVVVLGFVLIIAAWSKSAPSTSVVPQNPSPELSIAPDAPTQEIVTIDLAGTWTTKINETVFTVDVANSVVKITMSNNGKSMLYWYGSISNTGTVGEIITSTKVEFNKAVLSAADSKAFTVGKNTLTFEVSAMGKTRSVEVVHV